MATATSKSTARNTRQTRETRPSREQETRELDNTHEEVVSFDQVGSLPEIKSRPGFAQRWIRVKLGNDYDRRNLYAAQRGGWAPRDPKTAPQSLQWLTVQHEGLGGCIGTHDAVLMERHEEIQARHAEVKRQDRRNLTKAVKNQLFSEFKDAGGSSGISKPSIDEKAQVERGVPMVQDD